MKNNYRKALKSGIWYTASNFLVKGIGFITTPIFTRILTKEEFGAFNNYSSWLSIITIFVTLNLESTLISARYDYKDRFDEYILSVLSLSSISAAIWFIVVNVFIDRITSFLGLDISYINAMLLYLVFLPAVNLFQARERYYFEYKKTVITSLILSIGTALISVLLVQSMNNRLTGRIIGSVIPTVVLGVAFYLFFINKGKRIKIEYWKYALPVCLPYIPHLLSMTLLNSTDRVMIDKWCGSEATALYSLAYNCGAIITLLLTSMNSAFAPWLGEKIVENRTDEIRKFTKVYISAFVFLAIGIMLVSPEVLWILGGESYMEAIYVMAPVSMGCICQFLYTLFVNVEQFKKKTLGMAFASAIAAIVNLTLNYIFIPKIGYLAAAYTTLAGYLSLLWIHMYLVYRLKFNKVYSYRFVLGAMLVGLCAMILIALAYSMPVLRYIIIGVYCLLLSLLFFKFKNQILKVVKIRKRENENV